MSGLLRYLIQQEKGQAENVDKKYNPERPDKRIRALINRIPEDPDKKMISKQAKSRAPR